MSIIDELIRKEGNGTISFGNYMLDTKSKVSDFEHDGDLYTIPASHGEGRFVASKEWIEKLEQNGQIATRYVNLSGVPTMEEEFNPNGSYYAIEGITSPDGRVLGKMAHSERIGNKVAINISGNMEQKIFTSGVNYFQ